MSTILSQLYQDLQNELTLSNQLLNYISIEVNEIKELTNPGGPFENKVINNADLLQKLAKIQQIDLSNEALVPFNRMEIDIEDNADTTHEESHTDFEETT